MWLRLAHLRACSGSGSGSWCCAFFQRQTPNAKLQALKEDAGWSTTQYLFAGAFVLLLGDLVRVAWRYYEANSAANQTA